MSVFHSTPAPSLEEDILSYTLYTHEYINLPLAYFTKVHFSWTTLQFGCIAYLKRFGRLSMSQLASYLYVSKQQATQLISSLVKRGLVDRSRDEENRRNVYVSATDLAVKQLLEAEDAYIGSVKEYLSGYSDDRHREIISAMNVLTSFAKDYGQYLRQEGAPLMETAQNTVDF